MAEYRPYVVQFSNKGLNLRGVPDTIALDEYVVAANVTTDQEGSVRTRLGSALLNTAAVVGTSSLTDIHTLARLKSTAAAYRYAVSSKSLFRALTPFTSYSQVLPGTTWLESVSYQVGDLVTPATPNGFFYRATVAGTSAAFQPLWPSSGTIVDGSVTWTTGALSGNPMLTVNYSIGIDTVPWQIFADANLMFKDKGTGSPSLLGLIPPATAATPAVQALLSKDVETFQTATGGLVAYWSPSTTAGSVTLTAPSAPTPYGGSGSLALLVALSAASTATLTHSVNLNLNTFGSTAIGSADFMHIYVQSTAPQNISEMLLQLSIGDTTFNQRYEKALAPSVLTAGMNFTSSTHTDTRPVAFLDNTLDDATVETFPDDPAYRADSLEPGSNIWTEFSITRSDISPVTSTDTAYTWADVKAIRIKIQCTAAVNVYFDNWSFEGGGNLDATDYLWKFIYRNSTTGQVSNPSPATTALTTGPSRQSVILTGQYSRDAQVDYIDVYRIGGTATSYRFSGSLANLPSTAAAFSYGDNVLDSNLGDAIETDNDRTANFTGIELHNETLFGWGATGDPLNLLRFSKRVDIEEFPTAYYLYVGSGGDKIVRALSNGQQLVIFTLSEVYVVYGTGPDSYQVLLTGYNRGMIDNAFALSAAPGTTYHAHYDGIYAYPAGTKISQMIDGVFHGLTVNGIAPINTSALSQLRMQFYDNKLHVIYPSGSAVVNDAGMVYDILYNRWEYSTYSDTNRHERTLLYEKDSSLLLSGTTLGNIYQLETGTTDDGVSLAMDLQSKYIDLGLPDQDKIWGDMALDIDTAHHPVTVQLNFNNGDTSDIAISVQTESRSVVQIPIASGNSIRALNCQISIIGGMSTQVTIYKAIFRILVEPPRRRTYVTDWTDDGYPGRKEYRTLILDLDTLDSDGVDCELQLDGATTADQTFSAIQTDNRQVLYFGAAESTQGVIRRLKFTQVTDSDTSVFKLYSDRMEHLPQPVAPDVWQTEWTDNGYPYDKYWKEICLELDTFNGNRTVTFEVDGASVFSFTVLANGRQRITTSVTADTIGKLGRVVIAGGAAMLYTTTYVTDNEPPDVTRADSLEQTFGIDGWKMAKRIWIAAKNPAAMMLSVYADEVLRGTATIPASSLTTGWVKNVVPLQVIKGKLIRCVLTSNQKFKVYWAQSQMEVKPIRGKIGYGSYFFRPPQLM